MTETEFKAIVATQPFAPLVLLAIDLAAWLKSMPGADSTPELDGALTV